MKTLFLIQVKSSVGLRCRYMYIFTNDLELLYIERFMLMWFKFSLGNCVGLRKASPQPTISSPLCLCGKKYIDCTAFQAVLRMLFYGDRFC
jgi:hypothetical protein